MLLGLPLNRPAMSFSSLAASKSNMRDTRPSAKMFFPLSLAVPPMASTVSSEMGQPMWRYFFSNSASGSTCAESYSTTPPSLRKSMWFS